MASIDQIHPGIRLFDHRIGIERLVHNVESFGQVVFLSFKNTQTGAIDRQPFPAAEIESRFEILDGQSIAFRAAPEIVSLVAEAHRLQHAYLFNTGLFLPHYD